MQRLEVLVAVMLARERRVLADAEAGGCTALAAVLAMLPSGVLEIVAKAVVALRWWRSAEGLCGNGQTA